MRIHTINFAKNKNAEYNRQHTKMVKKFLFIAGLTFGIACQQPAPSEAQKDYTLKGDTIIIHDRTPLSEKVRTTSLTYEAFHKEISTAGVVKAIPTQFAQIAPPFSGRVIKSYMTLGQRVAENAPLFEISSTDFSDLQKSFFQAKSNYQLALQTLNRQQDLIKNGVGTKKDLEEAQNNLEFATQEYNNTTQSLKIFNVHPEKMTLHQNLIIRSPIAGEIIKNKLIVGQFLMEDTEPVAIVAELSKVWIVGQVKEKDIRYINKDDEVTIQVSAYPDLKINGKVFHIQEMVNDETRAVEVLIESKNNKLKLKPGMYVTALFQNDAVDKIMVQEKAVFQDEDKTYVFIQDAKNTFIKKEVETGATQNGKIIINDGLNANDIIVSEGGYYLLNAH